MINLYEEKINDIELSLLDNEKKGNDHIINSFIKQIEFNTIQESEIKEKLKLIGSTIDYSHLKHKTNINDFYMENNTDMLKLDNNKNNQKDSNDNNIDLLDNNNNNQNYNIIKTRVSTVEELIEKANSELQIQKHHLINEKTKAIEDRKCKEKVIKTYKEYINLFEKVKSEYQKFSELKVDKEKIKDVENTLKKLENEIDNFDSNLLANINKVNYENNSLLYVLEESLSNIKKLDHKILSMDVDNSNEISRKILKTFNSNSIIAKQNNILMQEIIYHSQSFYYKVFEKLLKPEKIDNFVELKDTIDLKKESMMSGEDIEEDIDEDDQECDDNNKDLSNNQDNKDNQMDGNDDDDYI